MLDKIVRKVKSVFGKKKMDGELNDTVDTGDMLYDTVDTGDMLYDCTADDECSIIDADDECSIIGAGCN